MAALDFLEVTFVATFGLPKERLPVVSFVKGSWKALAPPSSSIPLEVKAAPPDGPESSSLLTTQALLPAAPIRVPAPTLVNPAHLKCPLKRALFG